MELENAAVGDNLGLTDPLIWRMSVYKIVTSARELDVDIKTIDLESNAGSGVGTRYTITLGPHLLLKEGADLAAINLKGEDSLTINGRGGALDGVGKRRGLFVYSGNVTVENLTIENAVAFGGRGGSGVSG